MESRYFRPPPAYPAERKAYISWWRDTKEKCASLGAYSKTGTERMVYAKELAAYGLNVALVASLLEMGTETLKNYVTVAKIKFSGKRGNIRNNILRHVADEERRIHTHPDVLSSPQQDVRTSKEVEVKSNEEVMQKILSEYKLAAALIRAGGKDPEATTLASVVNKKIWVVQSFMRQYPDFERREKI